MYNKLFTKILDSSIWLESTPTRLVWVTLLAAMDQDGYAHFSAVGNLALRARVTLEEAHAAVDCFLSPDENSEDQEHEGRRIERIPGGFIVLNAAKYRDIVTVAVSREQIRKRVQKHRDAKRNGGCNGGVTQSETEAETETDSQSKVMDRQAGRFSEFWSAYPNKTAKPKALAKWKASKLDQHADVILAHIEDASCNDRRWTDGFIPNPATYLNQERWKDPIQQPRVATMGKRATAILALEAMKNG